MTNQPELMTNQPEGPASNRGAERDEAGGQEDKSCPTDPPICWGHPSKLNYHRVHSTPPATNNFYRAWRSPKKVLMQKSQKFCADFKYVNLKIELLQIFEKKSFSSLFLMRKPLSSDQKWFLRPYFPLIGGIFVLKSGLRFLFRALEVPKPRVRKRSF